MPFLAGGAALGGVTSLIGGGKQAKAATQAAQMQTQAATHSADLQNYQFERTRQDEGPFIEAGQDAMRQIQGGMPGYLATFNPQQFGMADKFSYDPSSFQNDPAFASAMKYGTQAIERSAAAKGHTLDPATMKALQSYGQDTAQQYYGQDYARAQDTYNQNYSRLFGTFKANQNDAFSKLAQVAGIGLGAATGTGQLGAQAASNAGNALMSGANSGSAGIIGAANGQNNALGGFSADLMHLLGNSQFQGWAKGNSSSYGSGQTTDGFGGLKF